MPTFFARRYMRGQPRRTERLVGALVLLLLGFIVLAFLLTGGLFKGYVDRHPTLAKARDFFAISEKPLFIADPANLPPPGPSRELRLARMLLPDTLGPDQPKAGPIRAVALRSEADTAAAEAGADRGFVDAVAKLQARLLYVRQYGDADPASLLAQVADLGEPGTAMKAFDTRKPQDARTLAIGRGGWATDKAAGFWSGRYYTELTVAEPQPGQVEAAARALSGLQLAYGAPEPVAEAVTVTQAPAGSGQTPPAAPGVARFAEVPGGRLVAPTRIERYAENLYEKINGKESAFRAFSVVDLKFGQYADPDARQTFDVYVYDMAAPVNAMGMYMSERVPSPVIVEIGREGYSSGTSVFFWKGQYYVNVLGSAEGGDAALASAKQIAEAIAATIADAGEPFWADKLLPADGRVPHSLSYQASSALGYEFLQRMYFVRYEADGRKLQMFVSKAADAEGAKRVYTRFAEATAKFDKIVGREKLDGAEMFVSETVMPGRPSKFGAAFHKGPYFGGVYDSEDQALAVSRAKAFFDSLSAGDPGDPDAGTAPAKSGSKEGDSGEGESSDSESGAESSEGSQSEY